MQNHYIMRFTVNPEHPDNRRVIRSGLTLEEAQAHCSDPATSGVGWFDGYQVGEPTTEVTEPVATPVTW